MCGSSAMKVDLWRLLNRFFVMAAAANFLYNLMPYVMLFLPDGRQNHTEPPSGHFPPMVHEPFSEERRIQMKNEARRMFYWGYDNYMQHAFPYDELNPINCSGRGHDWEKPDNVNINDVLGDYSLTLVDTLDTLVVMGNNSEFMKAVQLVMNNVTFGSCASVQVFEATIRVLGGLLSAHLLITDPEQPFGDVTPPDYSDGLLKLAHDLATRLLPSFQNTTTGLPHPRVNLCHGIPPNGLLETCTAGAGTLTLEFSLLSRLLGDPVYESVARRAVRALWDHRSQHTGLVGNVINIDTGQWTGRMSGLGAGVDSFYEYLLKSHILFGEQEDLEMFNQMYDSIMKHIKKGHRCQEILTGMGTFNIPMYVNVDYNTGRAVNSWIDSLAVSFAGVQILAGDLDEAICTHALYYLIWRKYGALPERFDWQNKMPNVMFYPLRPELVESTYLLYQATQNPFYLHVGSDILRSIEEHAKDRCGYATIHNVLDKSHEDRMESFFLSETCKYLYLLFDTDNVVNKQFAQYVFTTEGHLIKINPDLRRKPWEAGLQPGCFGARTRAVSRTNESIVAHSTTPINPHWDLYS
eukprot:Em0001g1336a